MQGIQIWILACVICGVGCAGSYESSYAPETDSGQVGGGADAGVEQGTGADLGAAGADSMVGRVDGTGGQVDGTGATDTTPALRGVGAP